MQENEEKREPGVLPAHLGIIMDGNGRWASQQGLARTEGHAKGAENAVTIARACLDRGVQALSFYAFSTENWKRPETEVSVIMRLLYTFTKDFLPEMMERKVRFSVMGDWQKLPGPVRAALAVAIKQTENHRGAQLNLGLNYGGRDEIVRATQSLVSELMAQGLEGPDLAAALSEEGLSAHLDTAGLPPLDFIIRTGGELRLSNFMLWEAAYAELYFTDCYWPDFSCEELDKALAAYAKRQRRFGDVK